MKRHTVAGIVVAVVVVQGLIIASLMRDDDSARPAPTFATTFATTTTPQVLPLPQSWPHAGAPRLIHLWATWCAPCREELPEVLRLAERAPVVVVSVDENDDVVAHHFGGRVPAAVVRMAHDDAKALFAVKTLPTTFLVDGTNIVRAVEVGARRWTDVDAVISRVHEVKP